MAINNNQKVDFLWKKIQFGVSNTSINNKAGFEEIYGSEVPTFSENIWSQSKDVQKPAPGQTVGIHEYFGTTNAIECTPDPTVPNNQTWLATQTYDDIGTRLEDWIPPTFDASYLVEVFAGDPNNGGTKLNQGTTGEEWVFDYVTGVLSFINNVPSAVGNADSTERVFIIGHRYVGGKGLTGAGGAASSDVVADIAERDALEKSEGMIVYVMDASGDTANSAHIDSGDYATYMYTGTQWRLIATESSARADTGTVTLFIDETSGNNTLYQIPSGTRVSNITVEVNTAFDTEPVINIGDSTVNDRLLSDNLVDLTDVNNYRVDSNKLYSADTDVLVEFNPNGATTGDAYIILQWTS